MKKGTIAPNEMGPVEKIFHSRALVRLLIIDGYDILHQGSDVVLEPGTERVGYLSQSIQYGGKILIMGNGTNPRFQSTSTITSVCMSDYGRIIVGTLENHTYLLERMPPICSDD